METTQALSLQDFHEVLTKLAPTLAEKYGGDARRYTVSPARLRAMARRGHPAFQRQGQKLWVIPDPEAAVLAIIHRRRRGAPEGNRNWAGTKKEEQHGTGNA